MSFEFDFTTEKLATCLPRNKDINALFEAFSDVFPKYDIKPFFFIKLSLIYKVKSENC